MTGYPQTLWLFYPEDPTGQQNPGNRLATARWETATGLSAEQPIGGAVADGWDITAIQGPGTQRLQLFYPGVDGGVRSILGDPIPGSSWTAEQNLGGKPTFDGGSIAAVVAPGLQLFYAGQDPASGFASVHSFYQTSGPPQSRWSNEQDLGGTPSRGVTAIVAPNTQVVQLFYAGRDARVYTIVGNNPSALGPGGWSAPLKLGVTPPQAESNITAILVPGGQGTAVVQLFYIGTTQSVTNVYTLKQNPDGTWPANPTPVNLGGTPQGGANFDVTAILVPGTELVQLFYPGGPGVVVDDLLLPNVCSLAQNPDGSWPPAEQNLGGAAESDVAVIVNPDTGLLQLFYVGIPITGGNSVACTLTQNPDKTWSAQESIGGGTPNADITAVEATIDDPCVALERNAAALQDEIDNDETIINDPETPPSLRAQLEQDLKVLHPQFKHAAAAVEACQQANPAPPGGWTPPGDWPPGG